MGIAARSYTPIVHLDDPRVAEALADAGARFAYLFGSRADEEERANSDVDIAVMVGRELGLLEEQRLADRLATALGASDIDLVMLGRAGLELRGRIVQQGRRIFSADEPARVAFEVRTRSEYFDYLPYLEAHTDRYLRQVAARGL